MTDSVDRAQESDAEFSVAAPETIIEPESARPPMAMEDLPESVQAAARTAGWTSLTPVQARAIPYILNDHDVMVQSRTGSGKTGAFIMPILARMDVNHNFCQALILVPTRELALQVAREAEALAAGSGVRSIAVYGGTGYGAQMDAFRAGAHVVIGTPGRILDHLAKGSLDIEDLEILIFDEADRMMSMGFYPDMQAIKRYLPKRRAAFMFSATYPPYVRGLAQEFLDDPDYISLSHGTVHISGMDHVFYEVPGMDKDRCLVRIIESENPPAAIIFCNTKHKVAYVTSILQRFGYDADQLTADLNQNARERVLESIRKGSLRFLVATDVAARGIDISHLTHVFLYEFPEDHESYIHRAGRTGRAGSSGVCMSLVSYTEMGELERVAARYSIEMERREVPTEEQVSVIVQERLTALLEQKLRSADQLEIDRSKRFDALAKQLTESPEELSILSLLLDEYYHRTLHAPLVPAIREVVEKKEKKPSSGGSFGKSSGSGGGNKPSGGAGGGGNRRRSRGPRK